MASATTCAFAVPLPPPPLLANRKPAAAMDSATAFHSSGRLHLSPPNPSSRAASATQPLSLPFAAAPRARYVPPPPTRRSCPPPGAARPPLSQAKFGAPMNWALDVFALPHNALRAECADLYAILESIQLRAHQLNAREMEELYMWWATFEVFIIEYFDFEADLLFPWVFPHAQDNPSPNARPVPVDLRNEHMRLKSSVLLRKEPLLDAINQINGTFELRRHVDIADVFPTILEEVNGFVPKLLDYFQLQEQHLPPLVAKIHTPAAKDALTKKYIQYIKSGEDSQMNLILLARWMETDVREKWVRDNIRGLTRFRFPRWEKRYIREHQYIPQKFHRRLLRSIRTVAASRIRRRADFGEDLEDISFGSVGSADHGSIRSLTLSRGSRSSQRLRLSRPRSKVR